MLHFQLLLRRRALAAALACVFVSLLSPSAAWSQAWPSKTVKIVVPYPAGGGTDVMARFLAQKFSEMWGQSVVVENKGGAGGNIGADQVAKSTPDGYTLVMMPSNLSINPSLFDKTPWDAVKDFSPIGTVATSPIMVGVSAGVPANSIRELIALAKAKPGTLNYISCGGGSPQHIAGEMFNAMAGVQMQHVPYKEGLRRGDSRCRGWRGAGLVQHGREHESTHQVGQVEGLCRGRRQTQ